MTDRDAMYRSILEAPAEDAARLVYADWLEEHPDDGPCPGCSVCQPPEWRKENRALCGGTGRVWNGNRERALEIRHAVYNRSNATYAKRTQYNRESPMLKFLNDWPGEWEEVEIRRGFVAFVHTTLADWLQHGPRIVAEQPVEEVHVGDVLYNWVTLVPGKLKRYEFQIPEQDIVAARSVDGFHRLLEGHMKTLALLFPDFHDGETQTSNYSRFVQIAFTSEIPSLSTALVNWAHREAGLPPLNTVHPADGIYGT